MKLKDIVNILKRVRVPEEEFAIAWNASGDCVITFGETTLRMNFKKKRLYRQNDKVEMGELVVVKEVQDVKRFIARHGVSVLLTVGRYRYKGVRELEILFAYLGNIWDIPLVFDVFRASGLVRTKNGFRLRKGTPIT